MDEMLPSIDSTTSEDQLIESAFQELLSHYIASRHRKRIEVITRAFNFARQAHRGVRRPSGEPYMMHPIAVALIVCDEIGLGSTSICAALLHDVMEDSDYTTEDIENIFGKKIARIVDGVSKISGGIFGEQASTQAENFKKLLLTMSDDIRVILVKMADRLHNMRNLDRQPSAKQLLIADETLYIYAPLANRLGLYKIKTELENLSFHYEHPDDYHSIELRIDATADRRQDVFRQFTEPIRQELDRMGFTYQITQRVKSVYSIYHKMQTKHVSFDEVYDLLAVRIIFTPQKAEEELNDCFRIYIALTKLYKSHPDRLRDWVNHPKANGYQALHVTLMSGSGQWIEVQIRSQRMHEIAEKGLAAHWKYKDGQTERKDEEDLNRWLLTIKEILDDPQPDSIDFLDTIKLNLFASEIFVFTPKGDFKTMPQGSTVLDFAFHLHTDIGCHCIGAKVNHKLVPLSHRLQSGDQVEILTSLKWRVEQTWLQYVTTARARAQILTQLRREAKAHHKKGEALLSDFLKQEDLLPDQRNIGRLMRLHNFHTPDELYVAIGKGQITLGNAERNAIKKPKQKGWKTLLKLPFGNKEAGTEEANAQPATTTNGTTALAEPNKDLTTPTDDNKVAVLTEESIERDFIMATCCHPIPGDEVLGYMDEGGRIVVHKRGCPVAGRLKSNYGSRIIATRWDTHKNLMFLVTLYIKGIDCIGLLNDVTQVLSRELNVNIRKLTIETNDGIFEGKIELYVHDTADVRLICRKLSEIKNIEQAVRVEG